MLNPSTADDTVDDPTIRRCKAFAARERCGLMRVVNLFTMRATKARDLFTASMSDLIQWGSHGSDVQLAYAFEGASKLVFAWGALPSGAPPAFRDLWVARARVMVRLAKLENKEPMALGVTKYGWPKHPLYMASGSSLSRWEWPKELEPDHQPVCVLCGEPMPAGEEMFKYHGFSGPCPKPPLSRQPIVLGVSRDAGSEKSIMVSTRRRLTDDEMRSMHDYLRGWEHD